MQPDQILAFWFEQIDRKLWWATDPDFDARIQAAYGGVLEQAAAGEWSAWRIDARGRLAEIIVLDQFSRNIFRGSPRAFAQDPIALVLAQEAVAAGALAHLSGDERAFLIMPFMHSESPQIHVAAETLFRDFASKSNYEFELRHKVIIDRFGRYPHRNQILGRSSTPEEIEFLKAPGSSF